MKICRKCRQEKHAEEFHLDKRGSQGLGSWCKVCKRLYDINYRESPKVLDYYASEGYKESKLKYRKERDRTDKGLEGALWRQAKSRATINNLPFSIEISDIIVPKTCPILEIPLFRKPYGQRGSFLPNSPSLDKINPKLGYIKGNIQVISMKANAMKYNATPEELKLFCQNILKTLNE